jgi:DNA-directed RNA polymerase subunit alpha
MLDFKNINVKKESETNGVGEFIIGPLPRGYGHTLANSLRRVLLSSLTGAAITSIKIAGAEHEYTSINGMQDDVLTFILKLKSVVINSYSEEPVRVKLNVVTKKGEKKVVTAGDIEVDASVEIINKELELTTLSDGGKINAEIVIEKGKGFSSSEAVTREEIGVIPVDAIFSPVENVEIKISNARVGHKTDYDQISLKITTNNSISATEALQEAFEIYNQLTVRLLELVKGDMSGEQVKESAEAATDTEAGSDEFGITVKDLKLSTRLRNALTNSAITDLRVLDGKTKEELLEIKGMGQKSADELAEVMKNNNLTVLE